MNSQEMLAVIDELHAEVVDLLSDEGLPGPVRQKLARHATRLLKLQRLVQRRPPAGGGLVRSAFVGVLAEVAEFLLGLI